MKNRLALWLMLTLVLPLRAGNAQERTVGLLLNDERAFTGFTLFAPLRGNTTYLINNDGRIVHAWEMALRPGGSAYLLDNGNLLLLMVENDGLAFPGGRVQEFDWEGNLVWDFRMTLPDSRLHHDVERLPNGNTLMIAWQRKSAADAVAAGRDTSLLSDGELWPEQILEIEQTGLHDGEIVWQWHAWDHVIQDYDPAQSHFGPVADHPEMIDLNYAVDGRDDWLHFNGLDYNPELDQIIVSTPHFNEVWILDHSTTTAEAAGHSGGRSGKGGDLLYRWGNPQAYRAGDPSDQLLFFQHHPHWIEPGLPGEGNLLIFNNGAGRPEGPFSSIEEIVPPITANGSYVHQPGQPFGPLQPVWSYRADNPRDFFSPFISSAQRLPNGNTLICSGATGTFFEVTGDGDIVWKYINPVGDEGIAVQGDTSLTGNFAFRILRYAPDFPGLAGRELTPGETVERDPITAVPTPPVVQPATFTLAQNYPNPFNPSTTITFALPAGADVRLAIYNLRGQLVKTLVAAKMAAGHHAIVWNGDDAFGASVSTGTYIYRIQAGQFVATRKLLLLK